MAAKSLPANSLSSFDRAALYGIIDSLGKAGKIYENEVQFQFDLAWEIRKLFVCTVYLEELTSVVGGKKSYTDIVLDDGKIRIAIELKYKTAKLQDGTHYLKEQGATDLGRYDYLRDIHRLEELVGTTSIFVPERKKIDLFRKCDKGFAVFLTNDEAYWKNHNWTKGNKPAYADFCFEDGGSPIVGKKHVWGLPTPPSPYRPHDVELHKDYDYEWRDYAKVIDNNGNCMKNGHFRYVAVEV